jgi:hypothetical protein
MLCYAVLCCAVLCCAVRLWLTRALRPCPAGFEGEGTDFWRRTDFWMELTPHVPQETQARIAAEKWQPAVSWKGVVEGVPGFPGANIFEAELYLVRWSCRKCPVGPALPPFPFSHSPHTCTLPS